MRYPETKTLSDNNCFRLILYQAISRNLKCRLKSSLKVYERWTQKFSVALLSKRALRTKRWQKKSKLLET